VQLSDDFSKSLNRIVNRPTERPRMQIFVWTNEVDLHVGKSAQAVADGRHILRKHRRIRDQHQICFQQLFVFLYKFLEILAADFFLPFNEKLEIHRKRAVVPEIRFNAFQVNQHLAFVIG
jgi:hypothetical protein